MLEYIKASDIEAENTSTPWLIDGIWLDQAVGIIGGEPKSYKSFLAFEIGIAIASGARALGRYQVINPGPLLLYAAEDALVTVKHRLEASAIGHNKKLEDLDVHVITVPSLHIDTLRDQNELEATVARLQPRVLVLDPFVRIQSVDENASGEVAKVLAFLRSINRKFGTSIILVHHARKRAGRERPGQSLRGSSEFHAWGDSNLYVRRMSDAADAEIELTIEHRSAPSSEGVIVGLVNVTGSECPILRYRGHRDEQPLEGSAQDKIIEILKNNPNGLSVSAVRRLAGVRNTTCAQVTKELIGNGTILEAGNLLMININPVPFPKSLHKTGTEPASF